MSVVPAVALKDRLQEHRCRQQPGEISGKIQAVVRRLFLHVDNVITREEKCGASTLLQEREKWEPRDRHQGTDLSGSGGAYKTEIDFV